MKEVIKIISAVIALGSAVVFGILLGKRFIVPPDNLNMEANIVVGQNSSFTYDIQTDILTRHALPSFERMETSDQDQYVNSREVIKKIENLGIDKNEFLYPEIRMSALQEKMKDLYNGYDLEAEKILFQGTTSDELQQAIDDNPNAVIDIHVDQIQLNNTITMQNNTIINGNGVTFTADDLQYGFVGDNISNIYINDICIEGNIDYGMYFVDCNNISISSSKINGMSQKPICIVGTTSELSICNNEMCNNGRGGLYIAGNVSEGIVESNTIENNGGTSNWMAGIVLTNIVPNDKYNIWEMFDEAYHFPVRENYYALLDCPHEILLRNNQIKYNNSSGIYSDGAYMCYVLNNTVYQNDKEGICLDGSTIGFYLKENVFKENGKRARQTDDDLGMDFVLEGGRMEDGSAKAKLPGVSLDDTTYNILENNIVSDNYGGGIKMVRSTLRTLIMENIIKNNNMGQNDVFHFFGIELASDAGEVSGINNDMSALPDYENIICRNSIMGNHYSGIFVGEGCYANDIFDNIIMEPQMFAVEAISNKFNSIVNNLSNAGIRNDYGN